MYRFISSRSFLLSRVINYPSPSRFLIVSTRKASASEGSDRPSVYKTKESFLYSDGSQGTISIILYPMSRSLIKDIRSVRSSRSVARVLDEVFLHDRNSIYTFCLGSPLFPIPAVHYSIISRSIFSPWIFCRLGSFATKKYTPLESFIRLPKKHASNLSFGLRGST